MRTIMTAESIKELGRVVRTLRKAKGWTQERLANKAGLSRDAIIKLERGEREPRSSTVERVSEAFDVDLYGLAGVRLTEAVRPEGNRSVGGAPAGVMGFIAAAHLEARQQAEATGRSEEEILAEAEREYARKYGSIFGASAVPLDEALRTRRGISLKRLSVPLGEAQVFAPGDGLADAIKSERAREYTREASA